MSNEFIGGLDYARLKRHYDCDDYVSLVNAELAQALGLPTPTVINGIPFTNVPTYYISGLMAALSDVTVIDFERGWTEFTHGQATAPVWLAPLLPLLGVTWPTKVAAFEAKDILFYATSDCFIRFEGASRVQHFIPANTYMRFYRRCFMFWVVQSTAPGVLYVWIEG